MSVSDATGHQVVRTHGGMPSWAVMGLTIDEGKVRSFFPYTSEIDGKRFLTRFLIVFTKWGGVHVTRIGMPDDLRQWPHDHSATFWSLKLWGTYSEQVFNNPDDLTDADHIRHRRFGIHRLRHTQAHSITAISPRTWTMLILGPRKGPSSYWTDNGKRNTGMRMDEEWG